MYVSTEITLNTIGSWIAVTAHRL